MQDHSRPGRTKSAKDGEVKKIANVIRKDRRRTVREVSDISGLSKTNVHRV